jgi:hypothetical protein
MADQVRVPKGISKEQFLDQIRAGVFDAVHELMTGGSGSPSDNFYGARGPGGRAGHGDGGALAAGPGQRLRCRRRGAETMSKLTIARRAALAGYRRAKRQARTQMHAMAADFETELLYQSSD